VEQCSVFQGTQADAEAGKARLHDRGSVMQPGKQRFRWDTVLLSPHPTAPGKHLPAGTRFAFGSAQGFFIPAGRDDNKMPCAQASADLALVKGEIILAQRGQAWWKGCDLLFLGRERLVLVDSDWGGSDDVLQGKL